MVFNSRYLFSEGQGMFKSPRRTKGASYVRGNLSPSFDVWLRIQWELQLFTSHRAGWYMWRERERWNIAESCIHFDWIGTIYCKGIRSQKPIYDVLKQRTGTAKLGLILIFIMPKLCTLQYGSIYLLLTEQRMRKIDNLYCSLLLLIAQASINLSLINLPTISSCFNTTQARLIIS